RVVGVPTRSVNGFYGGEGNHFGHYLALRQGDAHSWVEIWVNGRWITVDPTPPGSRVAGSGPWEALRPPGDNGERPWVKYVIEYDWGKEVDRAHSLSGWGQHDTRAGSPSRWLRQHARTVAALLAGLVAVWFAWRARRRAQQAAPGPPRAATHALHAYARA